MGSSIGIVGSGVSGLHLGLYLLAHDVPVTIYADKEPDDDPGGQAAQHGRPTTTTRSSASARSGSTTGTSAEYGYVCHHHCIAGERSAVPRRLQHPSSAIDYRVYLPRLMEDFQERGGGWSSCTRVGVEEIERAVIRGTTSWSSPSAGAASTSCSRGATTSRPTTAAAPAVGRDLQRDHVLRAEGRQHPFLAGPRRAARAADLLARRLRNRAAVRDRPRRRRRGARAQSATTTTPPPTTGLCSRRCAGTSRWPPNASTPPRSGCGPAATCSRARSLRSCAGTTRAWTAALRARRWRLPHRGRPDDGTGRQLGLVLRLDHRRSDPRRPRLRRALLPARRSPARGLRHQRLGLDQPDAQPAAARAGVPGRDGAGQGAVRRVHHQLQRPRQAGRHARHAGAHARVPRDAQAAAVGRG